MEAVGNWMLKVDLEEPFSAEYSNIMAVATKDAVTATVCFATLKDKAVNQIMNAINFLEEIKARGTVIILRNEAKGTRLPGIVEKGLTKDGEVDERDCLGHASKPLNTSFPTNQKERF
jgi:hypothetical protein